MHNLILILLLFCYSQLLLGQVKAKNKNEQLVTDWFDAYNRLDSAAMHRIFSVKFYSSRNGVEEKMENKTGPQLAIERMKHSQQQSPDRNIEILDLISENNKVVAQITGKGHNVREGKDYVLRGTVIFHIENGKIAKEWQAINDLEILRQLGFSFQSGKLQPSWRLIYKHDSTGKKIAGSKEELIRAVQSGHPVRYSYQIDDKVEHIFPAEYLTLHKGEVYAQNPPMTSQRWDKAGIVVWFGEKPFRWHELAGTDGNLDGMAIDYESNKVLLHRQFRREISWFVQEK